MSCVWPKFPSAKCSLVIDILSKEDFLSEEKLCQTIDCHYFSKVIQLISTNDELIGIVEQLLSSTKTLSYYLIKKIPVFVLIDKILINAFIKRGQLFGLSINREIDFDDCLALLPNGRIVLSLKESTYHRLGIVGKKSILNRNKNSIQKYLVEIDMNDDHFRAGTKHYQRTYECLQRSGLLFDILIKWEVSDEELNKESISSMSIQNFFNYIKTNSSDSDLNSIEIIRCLPSLRKFTNNYVPIPTISEEYLFEDIKDLIEWFGAQVCQIDCNQSEDTDVSTFGFSNTEKRADISCVELNGFFTRFDVLCLLTKLNHLFKSGVNSIIVNGFEDTPIAWKGNNNEHQKCLSGENIYGFGSKEDIRFIWRIADEYDFGIERL